MNGLKVNSAEIRDGKYMMVIPGTPTNAQQTIVFTLDDIEAHETHVWEQGGADELNLSSRRGGRLPPHVFVGKASLRGAIAADGTIVSAWVNGSQIATAALSGGNYVLVVDQGDISLAGQTITFKISVIDANETAIWEQGGGTELNLTTKNL